MAVAIAAASLALTAAPASALSKHTFETSFAGPAAAPLLDPTSVEVDQSTGDVYVADASTNQRQTVTVDATGGTFTLTFAGQTTAEIAFDAPANGAGSVAAALQALPSIQTNEHGSNVLVSGAAGGPYAVEFANGLGAAEQPPLTADASALTPPASTATTAIAAPGGLGHDVEKFTPTGEFILILGKEVNETAVKDHGTEAEQNVCTAESHDECQPGASGSSPGAFQGAYKTGTGNFTNDRFGAALFLALDNSCAVHSPPLTESTTPTCSEFDPSAGDLYVGDPGDDLVSKFDSAGHLISAWGDAGQLDGTTARNGPFSQRHTHIEGVAVDPADGDLLVAAANTSFYQFSQAGSFLATGVRTELQAGGANLGIALDRADDVYELNTFGIVEATPLSLLRPGSLTRVENDVLGLTGVGKPAGSLAVDPASGELYATGSGQVFHYCAAEYESCPLVETFGAGELSEPQGLAVDSSTGAVYVADTGHHRVAVFKAVPYLPAATPAPPTEVTATAAKLTGEVNPAAAGPITACQFESVPAAAFANQVQTIALTAATGTANLTAASRRLIGLHVATGTFAPGEPIEGLGIPGGTTVEAVGSSGDHGATLTLSAPATATGTAVALSARPNGGSFTLTEEGNTRTIPFDQANGVGKPTEVLFDSLYGVPKSTLNLISAPTGGPWTLEFRGSPFPLPTADASGLTPPGSTATVTSNGAGGGWSADGETASCEQPLTASKVTAKLTALAAGTAYRFRLTASNGEGADTSFPENFTTYPLEPTVSAESATAVSAQTALIHAQIDPNGGESAYHTSFQVEYLTSEQLERNLKEGEAEFTGAARTPSRDAGSAATAQELSAPLSALAPDTVYHYRVTATNECEAAVQCKAEGQAQTFTTLPFAQIEETCANAHVRQQTSAAGLLDCRAYELVSAPHTAGYDVESNLIEGQQPYPGYPEAKTSSGEPKLLYAIHDGAIPGLGEPTNDGLDPYLATRTPDGWSTDYVGLPASGIPSAAPYGSPLLEADPGLDAFAFGGPGLCSPCFSGGIETGIPLRNQAGELTQGMSPQDSETEAAKPDGYIAQRFSADGKHLVFGSTSPFAAGGNEETGDVSIYDRNLATGETHAVSNAPGGGALPCLQGAGKCNSTHKGGKDPNGIAELAISADGSHILVAQKVSEAAHNVYWRLYMDVGDSPESIELTPGASEGVLFDGASADGSRVFFTSKDQSLPSGPAASNLYEAEVTEAGATLHLIASGSGSCAPVSNANSAHWNSLESTPTCGALAIGGGGGVASGNGSIYFLAPGKLGEAVSCGIPCAGEEPVPNQPNLYLAAPGQPPRFIATLEPEDPLVLDALSEADTRHTADFQVTPSGQYSAFPSTSALAGRGEETDLHTVLYRYDAATPKLTCVSCALNGLPSAGDSSLAANGLSLTAEGRVFFNSTDPFLAADTDEKQDVYEWEPQGAGNCEASSPSFSKAQGACLALISAGTSTFDSGLLSADANGTDAYFFTRDSLVPSDENGPVVKVYDAREGGGFPYLFPPTECKASDECHGAASSPPPPIEAGSEAGTPHNFKEEPSCKKGFALKHGKCVQRHPHKHHAKKHHKSNRGAAR